MKKILWLLFTCGLVFGVEVAKKPQLVSIGGENGGYVKDNTAWSSAMLKEKVFVVFYVDPDEKDKNEHFVQALKAKHYDRKNYGSVAIINMAATWKPNFIIAKILASKQKEFKDTIYVKDKTGVLVKKWNLADNNSDVLVFDKDGALLFYKAGALNESDMKEVFELIETHI